MDTMVMTPIDERIADIQRTVDQLRLEHEIGQTRPRPGPVRRALGGWFIGVGFRLLGFGRPQRTAAATRP
jgi:hypothetical protein